MQTDTRARLFREFRCLMFIGIGKEELEGANIQVSFVDDILKSMRAMYEELGEGVGADKIYRERWFCGFTKVDPESREVEAREVVVELRARSTSRCSKSRETVEKMLKKFPNIVVVIEIQTKTKKCIKERSVDIRVYRIRP